MVNCKWCHKPATVVVIGGCLNMHVFNYPFCVRCAPVVRSAYCPECQERLAESIEIPVDAVKHAV